MRGLAFLLLVALRTAEIGAQTKPATGEELQRQIVDHDLWIEVRDSTDPKMLEDYLQKFPQGIYAVVAREKLEKLRPKMAGANPAAPAVTAPAAGTPSPPDALELLHRVQAAMGGAERLASIRNYRHVESWSGLSGGPLTTNWCATGVSLVEQGRNKFYFDTKAPGWQFERGAILDRPVAAGKWQAFLELLNLVLADRSNYSLALEGPLAIKIVDGDGRTVVLEIDSSSNLPLRFRPAAGSGEGGWTYSDWGEVAGVKMPFLRTIPRETGAPIVNKSLSWKLNTSVNCLELGRKPAGTKPAKVPPTLPAPDPATALPRLKGDTTAQAVAFLKKLQERLGGVDALLSVTDYERVFQQADATMRGMAKEHKLVERGCITGEMLLKPASPLIRGRELFFNGNDAGWSTMDGKYHAFIGGEITAYQRSAFNYDLFKMVLSDRDPDRVLSMVDDATIQIVDSRGNEAQVTVDPADGLPKTKISRFVGQKDNTYRLEEFLSDWRPVGRLQLPFHLKGYRLNDAGRGVLVRDVVIQDWKLNTGINCAELGARKP